MKLLAIRMARFGDIVLLLPALSRLKAGLSDAHLTFLTGHRCAPLAAMCPAIDEVISVDRLSMRAGPIWRALLGMNRLVRDVRSRKFDMVIDCHGLRETNLLAWLSGSRQRIGLKRFNQGYLGFCFNMAPVAEDKSIHVSEMFMRCTERLAPSSVSASPAIIIPADARQWLARIQPASPLVALFIDAPVPERIWPPERFAEVGDYVADHWGARVVVLSGPQGAHLIHRLLAHSRSGERFHVFSDLTIPQLAALIGAATLLVSNDTGPMHLGPALGVQTLGIFSVGIPQHFRPIGPRDQFVQGNPIQTIEVSTVVKTMEEMRSR